MTEYIRYMGRWRSYNLIKLYQKFDTKLPVIIPDSTPHDNDLNLLTHTDNTSNNGGPPGGNDYNPILGPNTQGGQENVGMGGMNTAQLEG